MSLFKTYLEQVKTEMNPDEMGLKKLAMEVIQHNDFGYTYGPKDIEFMKFLFYKLAIKSTKLNTIELWDSFHKRFFAPNASPKKTPGDNLNQILTKLQTPESEIKRAKRILIEDKFTEDNKIPFFTKLAEEKTHNKQLIKKVIKDIWG